MTKPRVLIATAWWPTKTRQFDAYCRGVLAQLDNPKYTTELFLTTHFAETKFGSIVGAMAQAQEWALAPDHGFTHVLNVEADRELAPGTLGKLLASQKPVVYAGRGDGQGIVRLTLDSDLERLVGWGVVLVEVDVLRRIPFGCYAGDYLWPDYAWWKKLTTAGIETWVNFDAPAKRLESSSVHILPSFQSKQQEETHG